MTPEQKAAYVIAQAACAVIEALGLQADNQGPIHGKKDFDALIEKYGIYHNAVLGEFHQ